jgi:hypothetical protein
MRTTLTLMLACTALFTGGCGGLVKGKGASDAAIAQFHQLYNEGKFDKIWKDAHSTFRSTSTKAKFNELMNETRRTLGKVKSTTTTGLKVNSYNFKTTVTMTQNTVFEKGKATETFTFEIEGNKAHMSSYSMHVAEPRQDNTPMEV